MITPYLEIAPEVLTGAATKLDEMSQLLSLEVGLSPRDRRRYQGLGRQRVQFVQLAMEHLRQNPELAPPYFETDRALQNQETYLELLKLAEKMSALQRKIADSLHYAGALVAKDSLAYYSQLKQASRSGVPGVEDIKTRLKSSLKRAKSSGVTPGNVSENEQAVA